MAGKKPIQFRETMENITYLAESGCPISSEGLYSLLQFVIDDVYEFNQGLGRKTMEAGNPRELVLAIRGILKEAIQALGDNEEGLRQLTARTREECRELLDQARSQKEQLDKIRETLDARDKVRAEWSEQCKVLEAEQAKRREVEQECEALQARAAQLNDGVLADKEALRDSLRTDLSDREKRNAALQTSINALEKALAGAQQEEAQKSEKQQKLQASVDELTRRIAELNGKAAFWRSERERFSKDVQEAERNNSLVSEQSKQYATIYTALNATLHDPILRENLFTLAGAGESLSVEAIPDMGEIGTKIESIEELDHWAAGIQARIEGLISIYQAQLRKIVELSERVALTGEK